MKTGGRHHERPPVYPSERGTAAKRVGLVGRQSGNSVVSQDVPNNPGRLASGGNSSAAQCLFGGGIIDLENLSLHAATPAPELDRRRQRRRS